MSHPRHVRDWAAWLAVLGDPSRLSLLLMIARDGPISVSELANASGLRPTTVSHSLRLLRAHDMVHTERDGQVVRYRLAGHPTNLLLRYMTAADHVDRESR